jgi:hypothetical protein
MIQKLNDLINQGHLKKDICNELQINKKKLDKLLTLELRDKLNENTRNYTNQNLLNRNKKLKEDKLNNLKEQCDLEEVKSLILLNKSSREISNSLQISEHNVTYIAYLFNIREILKQSNLLNRGKHIKECYNQIKETHLLELKNKYKDLITDLILNKQCNLTQLRHALPERISFGKLNTIVIQLELKSKLLENYKEQNLINCKINSKKACDKLRGTTIIRYEITQEMIDYYTLLKNCELYEGESRMYFHKKFKTSGPHTWNKLIELCGQIKKHPKEFLKGHLNLMFGKSPTNNAGKGISGHAIIFNEKLFFRSLMELKIYLYFELNNIIFTQSKHRIKYEYKNKTNTYCPDIVINDVIYEIKPEGLQNLEINQIKMSALKKYCITMNLKCDFIGYKTYDLNSINKDFILQQIINKKVFLTDNNYKRLLKNI